MTEKYALILYKISGRGPRTTNGAKQFGPSVFSCGPTSNSLSSREQIPVTGTPSTMAFNTTAVVNQPPKPKTFSVAASGPPMVAINSDPTTLSWVRVWSRSASGKFFSRTTIFLPIHHYSILSIY